MAVYNGNSDTITPTSLRSGDIINFPFSGAVKTITLPKGEFKLECWGAQGGDFIYGTSVQQEGGKGGYSKGTLTLTNETILYIYAGGKGTSVTSTYTVAGGGWNNGGNGITNNISFKVAGGGGGSDIRIGIDSLYARVIVAGGGGASGYKQNTTAGYNSVGGAGGGSTGDTGANYANANYKGGTGGSQTAAGISYYVSTNVSNNVSYITTKGSFGVPPVPSSSFPTAAGAGGGWYPGGVSNYGGAGGGSGYVFTSSTATNYPSDCLLTNDYYLADASTTIGTTSFVDYSGSTVTGHSGDGAIRITVIKALEPVNIPTITSNPAYIGSSVQPTISGYTGEKMEQSGVTGAIMPGTYTIIFSLKDGYVWSDGTLDSKSVNWQITSTFKKVTPWGYNVT